MTEVSNEIFALPIYLARYVGPSDTREKGLVCGNLYGIRIGYLPNSVAVRVADHDIQECMFYPDMISALNDWELPDSYVGR